MGDNCYLINVMWRGEADINSRKTSLPSLILQKRGKTWGPHTHSRALKEVNGLLRWSNSEPDNQFYSVHSIWFATLTNSTRPWSPCYTVSAACGATCIIHSLWSTYLCSHKSVLCQTAPELMNYYLWFLDSMARIHRHGNTWGVTVVPCLGSHMSLASPSAASVGLGM